MGVIPHASSAPPCATSLRRHRAPIPSWRTSRDARCTKQRHQRSHDYGPHRRRPWGSMLAREPAIGSAQMRRKADDDRGHTKASRLVATRARLAPASTAAWCTDGGGAFIVDQRRARPRPPAAAPARRSRAGSGRCTPRRSSAPFDDGRGEWLRGRRQGVCTAGPAASAEATSRVVQLYAGLHAVACARAGCRTASPSWARWFGWRAR
jgi:hypothetical protein